MNAKEVEAYVAATYPSVPKSPLFLVTRKIAAQDATSIAIEQAQITSQVESSIRDEIKRYAEQYADCHTHMCCEDAIEFTTAYLLSNFPDADETLVESIVSELWGQA
jgi:hypothetical protein